MREEAKLPGHAFISYVREDSHHVDRLQRSLEAAGIRVWRDTAELWPGEDWREKIRHAITSDAFVFIACFSSKSLAREKSFQNEELALAIDQLRLRRPDVPWLIPVRLDECTIPDYDMGGGRTLGSLHRADLFGARSDEAVSRLIATVARVLGRHHDVSPVTGSMLPSERWPIFYLSYAKARGDGSETSSNRGSQLLSQFFEDLSADVSELLPLPPGATPGFIDLSIPAGGVRWSDVVLRALGTCQVFVALLSAPYLESDWCGMEWFAFTQRSVYTRSESAPKAQTCILPVLWSPIRDVRLPRSVLSVQRYSPNNLPYPDLAQLYENEGIFGLMRMRHEDFYQTVVWQLARRIAHIQLDQRVEPRTFTLEELRNSFGDEGR